MASIVMVIGPNRYSTEGLHWCLHKAKEGAKTLSVVYAYQGTLSPDGDNLLKEIDKQSATFAHKIEIQKMDATYLEACEKVGSLSDTTLMVMASPKKSFLQKILGKDEFESLKGKINCEIKIYK